MLFIIPWSEYYIGRSECDFAQYPERAPEGVVRLATYLKNKGAEVRIAGRLLRPWTLYGVFASILLLR